MIAAKVVSTTRDSPDGRLLGCWRFRIAARLNMAH